MPELPTGTVTLLFTDIEGSTRLLHRAGDDYANLLEEHRRLLRAAFAAHDGVEVDAEGDAFFVAFASAQGAVEAAADAQLALARHPWPNDNEIRVRMGLHTGEPTTINGRYIGLAVHQGARVMAAGHGGQILISESTRALLDDRFQVRDLGEHRLKDLSGPHQLYQLQVEGLPTDFPPLKTLENRPTNLPVLTNALIGRNRELDEVQGLLERDDVRLLTLTGAGGTGKTRFALRLAAEQLEQFANGVFFVSLAPLHDWELVVPTIAQTLGLREQPGETRLETLTVYLRDKQQLLLLDNFEQVVAAAPAIGGLLATAPQLQVLVTSRTPLRLSGERTYPVPPLGTPNPERLSDTTSLMDYDAVRLFVERAQAATPDFELSDANGRAVAEICIRLDGLPLAIELAASRVRTLPPPALLRRLDQRLRLLIGGARDVDERQRTLRATIEWSYELLLDEERTLFARLGVFIGGCRLEAAEAVCDPGGELGIDLLGSLESLVEKSLVLPRADPDGEPRFRMLETIREYAVDVLRTSDALDETRRRHAEYFLELAERVDFESRTGEQAGLFAQLELENANLRAAVDWARATDDNELLLRLATALWDFWAIRGYVAEGRSALEDAVAVSSNPPARALLGLCVLRMLGGQMDGLLEAAREALTACEATDDDFSIAQAWNLIARIEGSVLADLARGEEAWRRALSYADRGNYAAQRAESISWLMVSAVFGALPAPEGIELCKEFFETAGEDGVIRAFCRVERAALEAMTGQFEVARQLLAEGRQEIEELGLNVYAAVIGQEAFYVEMLAGNPEAAVSTLRASYTALEQMGERRELATIAGFLAHALYEHGDLEEAERFSVASENAATPDDIHAQVLWRSARAKVLGRQGEHDSAEAMARSAVRLTEPTDLLNAQGFALLDLADVLALGGRPEEANSVAKEAAKRFERKGNLPSLERALRMAGERPRTTSP
jgi:predicted ATPase/class 3 adenylate cyclase